MNKHGDRLSGKRVLITGGAGGVGRAVAERMLAGGATLVITDRPGSALADFVQVLDANRVTAVEADLSDADGIAAIFRESDAALGGLDILVACAGMPSGPLMEMDDDSWRYVIESNLGSYVA